MIGWKAIVLAVQKRQIALGHRAAAGIAQRDQHACAFAVDAKILRAGRRDDHLGKARGDHSGGRCIGVEAIAKALIGKVNKRDSLTRDQQISHRQPLRARQVCPRGIVAAAMQQHDIARLNPAQIGQHTGKINLTRRGIEIAVFRHRHAKVFEY